MALHLEGEAHALNSQVGGHPGVMASEDDSLIIKKSLPRELEFYTEVQSNELLAPLRDYVPTFLGTLEATETGEVTEQMKAEKHSLSIVLENVTAPFKQPNVMDVKLGTVLYDEDASEEKKQRMIKKAAERTSFETGACITGFQVWNPTRKDYELFDKQYGQRLKVSQLPEAIAKFFPRSSISDLDLLLAIVEHIAECIERIMQALENIELRMIAASLLLVWEGDEDALRASVVPEEAQEDDLPTADDDDEEDDSSSHSSQRPSPGYAVKLIDFAHTRPTPGQGPDKGVLQGLDTTLQLLRRRIADLEQDVPETQSAA